MSEYLLRGALSGFLCDDCSEPLSRVGVRVYRREGQDVPRLVAADPKATLTPLEAKAVAGKAGALLAEGTTAADGTFAIGWDGHDGPIEIDVVLEEQRQISITVLQPLWRKREQGQVAAWQYAIPARLWCFLRALMDRWVICGRVTVCKTGAPAESVKVSAIDRDWLADDPLGTAWTDSQGRFRIEYNGADYRKGTWLDVELFGGPDVYFRVESGAGEVLLAEPASMGRTPGRENVGPCLCVRLCVEKAPVVERAWFTRVGDFNINSDIDPATGLTVVAQPAGLQGAHGGPGFAFYRTINLVGDCPTKHPVSGAPMKYRFLAGPTGGALQPVTGGMVGAVKVGTRPVTWNFGGVVGTYPQDIVVAPSGGYPGPMPAPAPVPSLPPPPLPDGPIPPLRLSPDANGWIEMPPDATNQGFSGPLLAFVSSAVAPGGPLLDDGVGNPVSAAKQKVGTDLQIVFEATDVAGAGPVMTNALGRIHVNNFDEVALFEVAQLADPGTTPCSGITTKIDIRYTVDHEMIASWGIGLITSAAVAPVLPSGTTPRGGAGTHTENTSAWPECAYALTFSRRLKLTDGENDDPGRGGLAALFCIRR